MIITKHCVTSVVLSLALVLPHGALAQLATFDAAGLAQQVKGYLVEAKSLAAQLETVQQEVMQVQQYAYMIENTIHSPVAGISQLLQTTGLAQDLPIQPGTVVGLVSGLGGPANFNSLIGRLSLLNSLTNSSYQHDHLGYDCNENSFSCQQSQQTAASIAGVKGIAGTLFSDLQNHMGVLAGLRTKLLVASDPKTVADLGAQLAVEQGYISEMSGQAQTVALLQVAQQRSDTQIATERYHQDLADEIAVAKAALPQAHQ